MQKILFTIGILVIFRIIAHIAVPGVDPSAIRELFNSEGGALAVFAALTGGSMENFSIVMMGLAPYINASIIIQLMTVVIPKLEQYSKEGESGQKKITMITRWLTLPLALAQSYGMIVLVHNMSSRLGEGAVVLNPYVPEQVIPAMITIAAGTMLLMWLGELITEKGIGNGISLLIFVGIISAMPGVVGNLLSEAELGETAKISSFLVFAIVTLILLVVVVVVMEAQRHLSIVNASRNASGEKSSLPIRLLQAGMIPIIFAISLMTFPSVMASLMQSAQSEWVSVAATWWTTHFNNANPTPEYLALYFTLIVLFSYFYVSIVFKPDQVAENIQKRGGFIPGIRPGKETAEYLGKVSNRMNLWGGSFLGVVALVPLIFTMFTTLSSSDLIISGAGLIIVVGVVLELIRQVNANLVMHDYDKLT